METLLQDMRLAVRRLRMALPHHHHHTHASPRHRRTTSIFTLVHAVLLKSYRWRIPTNCTASEKKLVVASRGYSMDKEFSSFLRLYRYLRDNTKGLRISASRRSRRCGVRRWALRGSPSYPGEFVSGNYFTMSA